MAEEDEDIGMAIEQPESAQAQAAARASGN
jgi:hypothetical protein